MSPAAAAPGLANGERRRRGRKWTLAKAAMAMAGALTATVIVESVRLDVMIENSTLVGLAAIYALILGAYGAANVVQGRPAAPGGS